MYPALKEKLDYCSENDKRLEYKNQLIKEKNEKILWLEEQKKEIYPPIIWDDDFNEYTLRSACFSDYSGSFVERANSKYLLEQYPELIKISSGDCWYGSTYTCINLECLLNIDPDTWSEFTETIDTLSNYCLLDSELLSEMEQEALTEHMQENTCDFINDLIKKYEDCGDLIENMNKEQQYELYQHVFKLAVENDNGDIWHSEEGGEIYVDTEKVIPYCTTGMINYYTTWIPENQKQLTIVN